MNEQKTEKVERIRDSIIESLGSIFYFYHI